MGSSESSLSKPILFVDKLDSDERTPLLLKGGMGSNESSLAQPVLDGLEDGDEERKESTEQKYDEDRSREGSVAIHPSVARVFVGMKKLRQRVSARWTADVTDETDGLYAHRALPKITMETLSGSGFNVILFLTYLAFGASILLYFLLDSGSKKILALNAGLCSNSSINQTISGDGGTTVACTLEFDSDTNTTLWSGTISNLDNLIGNVQLYALLSDTSQMENSTADYYLMNVDIQMRGTTSMDLDEDTYQDILTVVDRHIILDDYTDSDGTQYLRGAIFNSFQNQEIITNNGIMEGYKLNLTFQESSALMGASDIEFYEFHYFDVNNAFVLKVLQCVLCGTTLVYAGIWFAALLREEPHPSKWLREQKWFSWMLFGLFCFQNPVYCVAQWYSDDINITGWTAYICELLTFVGQASIFTVFMFLADGIRERTTFGFYFSKVAFGLLLMVLFVLLVTSNFPTLTGSHRSPLLAVANWPHWLQWRYAVTGGALLVLIIYWALFFVVCCVSTGRRLKKIPYIKARQQHLTYRFFLLQAVLVGAVFVLEDALDLSDLLSAGNLVWRVDKLADYLDALFNSQNESLAWVLFVSAYVYLACYLYFPVGHNNLHYFLGKTYVLREEDLPQARAVRDQDLRQLARFGVLVPRFVQEKPIFCVETARYLHEAAYQCYYEPPGKFKPAVEGALGPADFGQFGFEVADFLWDEPTDTNVYVLRHRAQKRLVVAFRGSMSPAHWSLNLKLHLQAIDVRTLCPRGEEDRQPAVLAEGVDQYLPDDRGGRRSRGGRPSVMERTRAAVTSLPAAVTSLPRRALDFAGDAGDTALAAVQTTADLTRLNRLPLLKHALVGYVHTGFFRGYAGVRAGLHRAVRRELLEGNGGFSAEGGLFVTGHSLGGALASLAAYDLELHTLPKVNAVLAARQGLAADAHQPFPGRVEATMYNFGSPRVGNHPFRYAYNKMVPGSFRVVTDGDVVAGLPPRLWYQHLGTEVIIDGDGGGSMIIDPSQMEKRFQTRARAHVRLHHMDCYRRGLAAILGEAQEAAVLSDLVKPLADEVVPEGEAAEVEEDRRRGPVDWLVKQGQKMGRGWRQLLQGGGGGKGAPGEGGGPGEALL